METFKAWCWNSLTVAWGALQVFAATMFLCLDQILGVLSELVGDPTVTQTLTPYLSSRGLGILLTVTGVVTILARLRTLLKKE